MAKNDWEVVSQEPYTASKAKESKETSADGWGVVSQEPTAETGFIPSVMRGGRGLLNLGTVAQAMAGKAVGNEEFANKKLLEAAEYEKETAKKYPTAVESFTDIKNAKDLGNYVIEAVGEAIPSLLPSLFTGGAASILGRSAVVAARQAAEKVVLENAAKGLAVEEVKKLALAAGEKAAQKVALKQQAIGAFAGSEVQNVPDVYKNIYDKTGQQALGPSIVAGTINGVLDTLTPLNLMRKFNKTGIPSDELIGAWYKRVGKGIAEGFVTEGGTESLQEMSSAAAEKFVDNNKNFFTKGNLLRFVDAGLKGGFGGAGITGATNLVAGKAEAAQPNVPPPPPPPPPPANQSVPISPALASTAQTATVDPELQTKIDAATEKLIAKGVDPEDAVNIATTRVTVAEANKAKELEEQASQVPSTPVKNELDQLTLDFIDGGESPERARELALTQLQEEKENDALAAKETKNATRPITTPARVSTGAPSQPVTNVPTGGVGGAQPNGVVPTPENVRLPVGGEATQPAPITPEQIAKRDELLSKKNMFMDEEPAPVAPAPTDIAAKLQALQTEQESLRSESGRKPHKDSTRRVRFDAIEAEKAQLLAQQGELSGAQTPETQQAETQGQAAAPAEQPVKETIAPTLEEQIKAEDERNAAFDAEVKKLKAGQTGGFTPVSTTPIEPVKQKRGPKGGPRETTVPKTKEEKNEYNQISIAADRAHKKLSTQLENPTSKTERESAVYELLKHKKVTQGRAVSKRIGETLTKHTTEEDIKRAEIRIANETKGAKKTEVGHTTTIGIRQGRAAPNIRFNYAENATQALQIVIKTGNVFQKLLARKLLGFVGGVKFTSIVEGEPLPEVLAEHADMWSIARATYVYDLATGEKHIFVRADGEHQGINNIDVLHEALHAATLQKLRLGLKSLKGGYELNSPLAKLARDILGLMARAKTQYLEEKAAGHLSQDVIDRIESVKEANGDLTIFTDPDEFLAYGMSDENVQNFLGLVKGIRKDESLFTQFVRSILNVFGLGEGYYTGLSDLIDITGGILDAQKTPMQRIVEQGEKTSAAKASAINSKSEPETKAEKARTQKQTDNAVDKALHKVAQSRDGEEFAKGVSMLQAARDPSQMIGPIRRLWASLDYQKRKLLVKLPTTEFLVGWAKKDIPELNNTYLLMQKMAGMTQNLLASGGELGKIIHNAYLKDPSLQKKIEDITLAATLAEVDPSNPSAKERSVKLDKMYADLGEKGQEIYNIAKEHFEDLSDYYTQLLNDQVSKSGLKIAEQANIMKKIQAMYETAKKISPYFPLVRRGDFWLAIGTDPKTREFYMYESMQERDAAAQEFADEKIKQKDGESKQAFEKRRKENLEQLIGDEEFRTGNDLKGLRKESYASNDLLRSIFDAIESSDLSDPAAKEALIDSVYQIYLNTMPEQSFRKQFINRKNITGFSTDFLQNVTTTSAKMAIQLARVKYASQMHNSLRDAKTSISGKPELDPYISEMRDRVANQLNPPPPTAAGTIAGILNKSSFVWYLSGASSAILQPLSVFQTGMPVLARYGAGRATYEMTKMMKFWSQYGVTKKNIDGSINWVAPSIAHSKYLTPLERKAVQEMNARHVSNSTYTSAIFEYKNLPTEKLHGPKVTLAKNTIDTLVLGGLMNSSERISREMMFLTSFRLNQAAKKTFEQSVAQATVDTNEALGNYGTYNRPLIMQGPIGKIALQFTMYPLHVTTFLIKNFKEMIKPMDGRTKAEAAKKFFGTLGTTFVLAGAVGLPGFSAVMGLLGVAWRDIFKDEDMPEDLKSTNFRLWFTEVCLPEQFPVIHDVIERGFVNAITGLNVSDRTGLGNLWMRDTKETKTVREGAMALAMEKAGPSANMILSWAEAYEAFINGDYQKGVEKALPAGFRNYVLAHKYATEGVKDYKGVTLLSPDSVKKGELIGQVIGFRSDLISKTQYVNFEVSKIEQRINNNKTLLLNNLDREYRNNDVEGFSKYLNKIGDFNKAHPSFAIEQDQIIDSITKRATQRAESYKGVTITEHNAPLFGEALRQSRADLYERERQSRK